MALLTSATRAKLKRSLWTAETLYWQIKFVWNPKPRRDYYWSNQLIGRKIIKSCLNIAVNRFAPLYCQHELWWDRYDTIHSKDVLYTLKDMMIIHASFAMIQVYKNVNIGKQLFCNKYFNIILLQVSIFLSWYFLRMGFIHPICNMPSQPLSLWFIVSWTSYWWISWCCDWNTEKGRRPNFRCDQTWIDLLQNGQECRAWVSADWLCLNPQINFLKVLVQAFSSQY